MLMHKYRFLIALPCWLSLGLSTVSGQEAESAAENPTAEIESAIAMYADAFNSRELEKLANSWTENGVYISRVHSERVDGREAMTAQFKTLFESSEEVGKLTLLSESIDFVSPRVAVETGRATVAYQDQITETSYETVFVKDGDKWLIDRVTEQETPATPLRYEKLKGLDWLIGQWVDNGEGFTIEIDCNWTSNQTYISRKYSVTTSDGVTSSGLQLIGWDQKQEKIRSWLFDSDGGFVSGVWTQRDNKWKVQSVATLADGSAGSFVGVFRPTDDGNYTWQKINQVIDGELLPNLDEVTVIRK
ncbi:MAG: SgcJ/EcaC family oxidoreductase [Rubripirellula sp.]|nr:SgcJ/EcaC family oxidoreductase [Rubripirellula sp.]